MRFPFPFLAAAAALACGLAPAAADDNFAYLSTQEFRGGGDNQTYGLAAGVVVCERAPPIKLRPVAWFGAAKPLDGKSRFLYLLILKTPADFDGGVQMSFDTRGSSDTGADGSGALKVGGKKVELAYKIATDPKTHAVRKQTLTVAGKEVKEGEPRVFVVDLTGEAVTVTPVKVELPAEAPDVGAENDGWGTAVRRAVDQLKKDSPELRKLLDAKK